MKISMYIPKGTEGISNFIAKEIATARNIQSKQTKDAVISTLNKINHAI